MRTLLGEAPKLLDFLELIIVGKHASNFN